MGPACLPGQQAPQELRKSGVLTERRAEVFLESRKYESVWRKEFAGLAQKNIRVIAECDPDYPTRFLPYKDRPAALFVKGSLPENEVPSVAIVGARACTEYGKEAAKLGKEANPREMWLTHYSPSLMHPEEYLNEIREIFPKIKTARDGWSAELGFDED